MTTAGRAAGAATSDLHDTDPLLVASRWREAVEAGDMVAFASLYASDASVWTNLESALHPLGEHLTRVSRARGAATSWVYTDVRCQRTETGFLSEHTVTIGTRDGEFTTCAAIVATVRDGCITALSEYLTTPRRS